MSISRGRYVATFRKPWCDWKGKKINFGDEHWYVCIDEWGVERRHYGMEGMVDRFQTFAEARKWAIERLNELTEGT